MELIQILIIIFALFALSRIVLRKKDKSISYLEMFLWGTIWLSVLIIAFVPRITNFLSAKVGISNGFNLLVYASIMLLFYLIFRMYVKIESLEQDITKLVRELAKRK